MERYSVNREEVAFPFESSVSVRKLRSFPSVLAHSYVINVESIEDQ